MSSHVVYYLSVSKVFQTAGDWEVPGANRRYFINTLSIHGVNFCLKEVICIAGTEEQYITSHILGGCE